MNEEERLMNLMYNIYVENMIKMANIEAFYMRDIAIIGENNLKIMIEGKAPKE